MEEVQRSAPLIKLHFGFCCTFYWKKKWEPVPLHNSKDTKIYYSNPDKYLYVNEEKKCDVLK